MSVFVCLSASILQNDTTELNQIFYVYCLWPWLDPPMVALQYVMYFQFVDDVMLSYNGPCSGMVLPQQHTCCSVVRGLSEHSVISDCGHQDETSCSCMG